MQRDVCVLCNVLWVLCVYVCALCFVLCYVFGAMCCALCAGVLCAVRYRQCALFVRAMCGDLRDLFIMMCDV